MAARPRYEPIWMDERDYPRGEESRPLRIRKTHIPLFYAFLAYHQRIYSSSLRFVTSTLGIGPFIPSPDEPHHSRYTRTNPSVPHDVLDLCLSQYLSIFMSRQSSVVPSAVW